MVRFATIFTASLLTTLGYSAPTEKSIKDIVTGVYGPLDTWMPVYLIDVYPDALIDGAPANSSVILRYDPPAITNAQRDLVSAHLSARSSSLQARDGTENCFNTGTWIFQNQLFSAENDFCSHAQDKNLSNGGSYWENLSLWFDHNTNNWAPFTTAQGTTDTVFWNFQVNPGFQFNWNVCFNAMWTLINDCHGSNPDSAGGQIWGYNNGQVDATIDPWD
ncbi:hypothetical protein BKA61DRAFT_672792 [Leptodontidium sp. MPI-SDFR-AT-0119]|nr:hypothetical protein BKA61DRAFT_672792 [Leptodontidium sp. MPI-SDFR-AT-0119]